MLDQGTEKLRTFAEYEGEEEEVVEEDGLGLGFEMVDNSNDGNETTSGGKKSDDGDGGDARIVTPASKNKSKGPKEALRHVAKYGILPLVDRISGKKDKKLNEDKSYVEEDQVLVSSEECAKTDC